MPASYGRVHAIEQLIASKRFSASRPQESKRLGSRYRSGRSPDLLKFKNPTAPAVKREAEEDWR
jgi:hypothetical protein